MLPQAKKHFWTTMDVKIFKPNNHAKLQTSEIVYRWLGKKKDNISFNT